MDRVAPLPRDAVTENVAALDAMEQAMGFVPNSLLTLARVPGAVPALTTLAMTVLGNPVLPRDLTQMVAMIASAAGGCRYCQAHTGHVGERLGIPEEKLADVWLFETSEHFSDAERVALRLAFHSGQVPNAVTDDDVEACRAHFDDDQIAGIVATSALFGFLNRWNDTMATGLEAPALEFAERVLGDNGWDGAKHLPV